MKLFPLEKYFEMACRGVQGYRPFWEHVLGSWNANLEQPGKILFLKYDLKEDVNFQVKRLAEFLGCPFSVGEESRGVIEEISKLCSFDHLKHLEVNKSGKHPVGHANSIYFRKGLVVDLILGVHQLIKSRDFSGKIAPEDALRVIEVEINLIYEVLYTKGAGCIFCGRMYLSVHMASFTCGGPYNVPFYERDKICFS
ncbi:hypothetical protein Dsin_021267 [Dipteronia sinensis]|uniref:Sulfotransferase n=1 Tax=Dipteronia sinensis TaxID=43782 RepID=A0AAE0A077_9ROSI|nr:hypothetical protein Dsin_021267 [Dipteronia sinensis]